MTDSPHLSPQINQPAAEPAQFIKSDAPTLLVDSADSGGSAGIENVFAEFSEEFDPVNLSDRDRLKFERVLSFITRACTFLAAVAIIFTAASAADVAIKNHLSETSFLSNFGLCSYIIGDIDYQNPSCRNLAQTAIALQDQKTKTEEKLTKDLATYLSLTLPTTNVLATPEVRFIAEKTSSRVPILEAIDAFNRIREESAFRGEDIHCTNFSMNAEGRIKTSCEIYGSSVLGQGSGIAQTSRKKVMDFLNRVQAPSSGFLLLDYPTQLNLQTYQSSDPGIQSVFSTVSTIQLDMQYHSVSSSSYGNSF